MKLLITGGAGFIGSHFVRHVLDRYDDEIVVLDKLTYAGHLANLEGFQEDRRFHFVRGDIGDHEVVQEVIRGVDGIVNFAAETHVDRSIVLAGEAVRTNVLGTHTLLEAARRAEIPRFVHVSTDEVYGSIEEGHAAEGDPLAPSSPYSAAKAGADLLCLAYWVTYGYPVSWTRGSNTYGPYQYPEKVIPRFVTAAIDDEPLPLYGDGLNIRDWMHVEDHCAGIDLVLREGRPGEGYNLGAGNEVRNIDLTNRILEIVGKPESLITYVPDRPGHDRRYAIDCTKAHALGWSPKRPFDEGFEETVRWYLAHEDWWRPLKARLYQEAEHPERQ